MGYMIALDDFVDSPDWAPLVALADIIKVDFRLTGRAEQRALVSRYAGRDIRMLAEKVETQEEYSRRAWKWGTRFSRAIFSAARK